MPQDKNAARATLTDRRKAADAILHGFADAQTAAVLTAATSNGYVYGKLAGAEAGGTLPAKGE